MKALFWKEWRENLKWALLAAACVTGAMFYTFRPDPQYANGFNLNDLGLCSKSFLLITGFGFPVIGAAFGFLQILTELRRDQWAFLVHRPVTRSEIYLGKAVPGALLYALATIAPLFVVAYWSSQPGCVPMPFDWTMAVPGLIDGLSGLGFYFAALWTGIEQGPWYGRRMLPLVAACWMAAGVKTYSLNDAVEIALLAIPALALGSAGAFQGMGGFRRMPRWGKIAALLSMLMAASILQTWYLAVWEMIFPRPPYTSIDYRILKDGKIVKVVQKGSFFVSVRSMDGREIKPEGKGGFRWDDFLNMGYLALHLDRFYRDYRGTEGVFCRVDGRSEEMAWYYVIKRNQFAGYNISDKRVAMYMGPDGFATANDPDKAGGFVVALKRLRGWMGPGIFVCDHAAYQCLFDRLETSKVFEAPAGERMLSGGDIPVGNQPMYSGKSRDFAIVTDKFIREFSADGRLLWQLPQPDLRPYSSIRIGRLADSSRDYLFYQARGGKKEWVDDLCLEVSPSGQISGRTVLPGTWEEQGFHIDLRGWYEAAKTPFGQTLWEQILYRVNTAIFGGRYVALWQTSVEYREYIYKIYGAAIACGLICALLAQGLLRRPGFSGRERMWWSLFIVFYNIAGLLVFLIANDWPRRVQCHSCGSKRSVTEPLCESCGAKWPSRDEDGTEIFEAAAG